MKLLNAITHYLRALFGKTPPPPIEKKKRVNKSHYWTLKNILGRLDLEHKATRVIYKKAHTSLSKGNFKTLRKQGPFIMPDDAAYIFRPDRLYEKISEPYLKTLPTIVFIGANDERVESEQAKADEDADHKLPFRYLFALKLPSLDWRYEKTPGVRYAVGFSFFIDGIESAWAAAVTIDPATGFMHVPRRHDEKYVRVEVQKHSRRTNRKVKTAKKKPCGFSNKADRQSAGRTGYTRKSFKGQDVFDRFTTTTTTDLLAKSILTTALHLWKIRADYWQVSTRKKDSRVSFGILPNDAKYFFKDRDATAVGPDGKRRKIIHFVRAHSRNVGGKLQKVKAHLRGVRNFYWGNYEVAVTVPKKHLTAYACDVPLVEIDKNDAVGLRNTIAQDDAADRLSNAEDYNEYRHGKVGLDDVLARRQ